ncbi:hypothetical protein K474DRAFT_897595 [Panus rudis PR-1116 ss-1]|nr:hypothetical protein K474DRAFT_897595 [Panus rudis PR-1116 ss-1]
MLLCLRLGDAHLKPGGVMIHTWSLELLQSASENPIRSRSMDVMHTRESRLYMCIIMFFLSFVCVCFFSVYVCVLLYYGFLYLVSCLVSRLFLRLVSPLSPRLFRLVSRLFSITSSLPFYFLISSPRPFVLKSLLFFVDIDIVHLVARSLVVYTVVLVLVQPQV